MKKNKVTKINIFIISQHIIQDKIKPISNNLSIYECSLLDMLLKNQCFLQNNILLQLADYKTLLVVYDKFVIYTNDGSHIMQLNRSIK